VSCARAPRRLLASASSQRFSSGVARKRMIVEASPLMTPSVGASPTAGPTPRGGSAPVGQPLRAPSARLGRWADARVTASPSSVGSTGAACSLDATAVWLGCSAARTPESIGSLAVAVQSGDPRVRAPLVPSAFSSATAGSDSRRCAELGASSIGLTSEFHSEAVAMGDVLSAGIAEAVSGCSSCGGGGFSGSDGGILGSLTRGDVAACKSVA
jgi:hypothetical protein